MRVLPRMLWTPAARAVGARRVIGAMAPPTTTQTFHSEGRNHGRHGARTPARNQTTHSHTLVHRGRRTHAGARHWCECLAVHGRAPRRVESAALSPIGSADCAGLRTSGPQHPVRAELDGLAAVLSARRSRQDHRYRRPFLGRRNVDRTRRAGARRRDTRNAIAGLGASRVASDRPMVYRSRRHDWRCVCRGAVARIVDAPLRRRSRHRRPADHTRW